MSEFLDTLTSEPHAWVALAIAFVVALVCTPLIGLVARSAGAVDVPAERRVHDRPTPTWGGIAIVVAILAATVTMVLESPTAHVRLITGDQLAVTLAGAAAICIVGAFDDLRSLSWRVKLAFQVLVAVGTIFVPLALPHTHSTSQLALVVHNVDPPLLAAFHVPLVFGAALATIWIVAMMNMINFVDGVDGLAAGICAIGSATFAIVAASYGRLDVAILAGAMCGSTLGFLPANFRRGGARIFMGDSGSLALGYLLAVVAIEGVLKTAAAVALVIPLALLALPILDTVFVVAKRLKHNVSVANPDRWHLHHRLLNVGYSPRRVAISFWLWSLAMSGVALAMRFVHYGHAGQIRPRGLITLGIIIVVAAGLSIYLAIKLEIVKLHRVRRRNARLAEQARRTAQEPTSPTASDVPPKANGTTGLR